MKYLHSELNIRSKNQRLSDQFHAALVQGEKIYTTNSVHLEKLTEIRFLTMLLHSRMSHLNAWITKTNQQYVEPILQVNETTLESVIMKSMKLCDVEKRVNDKKSYKNQAVVDGQKLLSLVSNQEARQLLKHLAVDWETLLKELESERHRLDELVTLWREFKLKAESLEQWLSLMMVSVTNRNEQQQQLDIHAITLEQEFLGSLQNDLKAREPEKLDLSRLKERIATYVNQPVRDNTNENSFLRIEQLWMELNTAFLSQLNHIANLNDQVEIDSVNELVSSLHRTVTKVEDVFKRHMEERWLNSTDLEAEITVLEVNID